MTAERYLGQKIRQLREAQQISIDALAERCCCGRDFLAHIESGQHLPSLAPLMKIARGLGVRPGTLLDDEYHNGPIITRQGDAEEVVRFADDAASAQGVLDFYSLASHKKDRHMEPFLITVHPGASGPPCLSSHEGEEFIFVLQGSVTVFHGRDCHQLASGDSIYYDSIIPHEVRTSGAEAARILAVVYAPF